MELNGERFRKSEKFRVGRGPVKTIGFWPSEQVLAKMSAEKLLQTRVC